MFGLLNFDNRSSGGGKAPRKFRPKLNNDFLSKIKKLKQEREKKNNNTQIEPAENGRKSTVLIYPTDMLRIGERESNKLYPNIVVYGTMGDAAYINAQRMAGNFPSYMYTVSNSTSTQFLSSHVAPKINGLYVTDIRDVGFLIAACDTPSIRAIIHTACGSLGNAAGKVIKCFLSDTIISSTGDGSGSGSKILTVRTFIPKYIKRFGDDKGRGEMEAYDMGNDFIAIERAVSLASHFEGMGMDIAGSRLDEMFRYSLRNNITKNRVECNNTESISKLEREMKILENNQIREEFGCEFIDGRDGTDGIVQQRRLGGVLAPINTERDGEKDGVDEMIVVSMHIKLPPITQDIVVKYSDIFQGGSLYNLNNVVKYLI